MDIKRIASALLGFPLVVIILTFGNKYVVDIFLSAIALLAMQEYSNAVQKECNPVRWLGYVSCIFIGLIHIVPEHIPSEMVKNILLLLIPILLLISFTQIIITNMKTNFKDIAYTIFGILYIVTCISFIALIRGGDNGRILVWYSIIAAWGTDTFAYLIGKKFGKHKFSKVSPKKSIEGCIAGIIGAIITVVLYTIAINSIYGFGYSYVYIIIVTAILSIIGQIGDFAASSIKRYVDVKDYSNLIPGHGGMLDRIDSLMFLAPFAYIFFQL
jgi:phosphatidate cytidylyltransferase